jgi:uncharacterized protein with PIN domain
METNRLSAQPTREQLRKQWMESASAAFDLMFGESQQEQLVTLTQREKYACDLSQDLARWLLERHVSADTAAQPEPDRVSCPKCGRPARKVTKPAATAPQRPVTTLAGDIEFAREQWRCPRCRILFFSAR